MNDANAADYAQWVKLANDPSQSEETRQQYRARMEAYVHQRMRDAFRMAAQQTATFVPPLES